MSELDTKKPSEIGNVTKTNPEGFYQYQFIAYLITLLRFSLIRSRSKGTSASA